MSELRLLVLAQTMILIGGKMDLSLESTIGLAPGVAVWLVRARHRRAVTASDCCPTAGRSRSRSLVGALVGAVNGL